MTDVDSVYYTSLKADVWAKKKGYKSFRHYYKATGVTVPPFALSVEEYYPGWRRVEEEPELEEDRR